MEVRFCPISGTVFNLVLLLLTTVTYAMVFCFMRLSIKMNFLQ